MRISKYLFELAKSPLGDFIVGLAFGNFSTLLPIKRIKESDTSVAFWHPKPFWEYHILIVPKHPIKNLLSIDSNNSKYVVGMYSLLKEVIRDLGWEQEEYSTLINGGKRQEVGQLHMHIFKGKELDTKTKDSPSKEILQTILNIYPFMTEKDREDYSKKISQIPSTNELELIEQYLKALNNPHAVIRERQKAETTRCPTIIDYPSDVDKMLPISLCKDEILYMYIPSFSAPLNDFSNALDDILINSKFKACIIDVRNNGGGNERLGQYLANYFLDTKEYCFGTNISLGDNNEIVENKCIYKGSNLKPFCVPTVVLVSTMTASSCERFVALMKELPSVTIMGSNTWGGSANPRLVKITIDSNEYTIAIPTWRFYLTNEKEPLEVTKIKPDIYEDPMSVSIIQKAKDYLKEKIL